MKTLDKILTIVCYIITIAPFLILGAYSADSADKLIADDNVGLELILMGGFIFLAVFFMLVHIIIHEGGHLVMGLATGWKYLSFRIGSIALVKRDGKLQWKKTTVVGTGGQCLMIPPECEPTECPFFLYLLGGGLFNIITGGIARAGASAASTVVMMIVPILVFVVSQSNIIETMGSSGMKD